MLISFYLYFHTLCLFGAILADIASLLRNAVQNRDSTELGLLLILPSIDTFALTVALREASKTPAAVHLLGMLASHPKMNASSIKLAFWHACTNNYHWSVSQLLEVSLPYLVQDLTGLYLATEHNNMKSVQSILSNQYLNIRRSLKTDFVMKAIENGNMELVKLFMSDYRVRMVSPELVPSQNKLIAACVLGDLSNLKQAISEKALPNGDFSYGFLRACENGRLEVVQYLLGLGLQDSRPDPSYSDNYALRAAFKNGHSDIVSLLLKEPSVRVRNPEVMRWAIREGREDDAIAIVPKADFFFNLDFVQMAIRFKRWMVLERLLSTVHYDNLDLTKLVLDYKDTDQDELIGVTNRCLFLRAVRSNDLSVVVRAIQDMELPEAVLTRALTMACFLGLKDISDYLLKTAANPAASDGKCLIVAVQKSHISIVRRLLSDSRVDPGVNNQSCLIEACKIGDIDIVNLLLNDRRVAPSQISFGHAVLNNNPEVVKRLINLDSIDPCYNGGRLFSIAVHEGFIDIVKIFLSSPRFDPTLSHNNAFYWALRKDNIAIAKLIFADPRVNRNVTMVNLVVGLGIRKVMDARKVGITDNFDVIFNQHLKEWNLSYPSGLIVAASKLGHPDTPSLIEKFIMNVFFDSRPFFFHEYDTNLRYGPEIYDLFRRMLKSSLGLLHACSDEDKKRLSAASEGLNQLLEITNDNFSFRNMFNQQEVDRRREYIQKKINGMKVNDRIAIPLLTRGHISIGVLERNSTAFVWYVFNSGDGTSTTVIEGNDTKQCMFEMYAGISTTWLTGMFVNMDRWKDPEGITTYRDDIYPSKGNYVLRYESKATVRGQRSSTCLVRSVQLYLLAVLGRPLYTEVKFASMYDLHNSVSSKTNNSIFPGSISFLGERFLSYYSPVWTFVSATKMFPEMMRQQLAKLDKKPRVTIGIYEPEADEQYGKRLEKCKSFCTKLVASL